MLTDMYVFVNICVFKLIFWTTVLKLFIIDRVKAWQFWFEWLICWIYDFFRFSFIDRMDKWVPVFWLEWLPEFVMFWVCLINWLKTWKFGIFCFNKIIHVQLSFDKFHHILEHHWPTFCLTTAAWSYPRLTCGGRILSSSRRREMSSAQSSTSRAPEKVIFLLISWVLK